MPNADKGSKCVFMKWTDTICDYIAECLAETGILKETDKKSFSYSLGYLADGICYNLSLLLIGILLGYFWAALLYILIMTPVRMLAGGIHAPSPLICDIVSYGIFLGVILAVPVIVSKFSPFLLLILYFICYTFIILLSPVDTREKHYSGENRRRQKRHCFVYLTAVSVLYLILFVGKNDTACGILSVCAAIITGNLILGIIANHKERWDEFKSGNLR